MTQSKSDKTVGRIMAAATLHFARHGFDGARMDGIAKEAGVNKATIYYHLGGKKKLYTVVLHEVYSEFAALMSEQVAATPAAEDKLRVIFGALKKMIYDYPHISAIMMYEVASGGRNFPDILTKDFTQIIGLTADALEQSQEAGHSTAVHPMVIYLMTIAPLAYYEKIHGGLRGPLTSGSKSRKIEVLSLEDFAHKLEALILSALKRVD